MAIVSESRNGIDRITLYAMTALAMQLILITAWAVRYYVLHQLNAPMLGWDFVVFWSAARVALEYGAAMVFSPELMYAMEARIVHFGGVAPWPYPPTFLLTVIPIGLLSFGTAFAVYSVAGVACYAAVIKRLSGDMKRTLLFFIAAFPGVAVALAAGQNSLFTVAAAGAALVLVQSNSALAGVAIAALAIKPQLAILFPLALICARKWKILAASALCSVIFVAITVAMLGHQAWTAFAAYLPVFSRFNVEQGMHLWTGMPTAFAAARLVGLPVAIAYGIQALVAIPAVGIMAFLWLRQARFELRAAALVIATLLVLPYFMYYDLCWIVLPLVFLIRDGKAAPIGRVEWAILGAAWLMPAQGIVAVLIGVPCDVAPLVLIALLGMCLYRHLATSSSTVSP
ncbi:DUF2029 domain-containing protein [Trinickia sp. LjRoot230]|uniref:glycosyltransferase family 87 protein n=1 Tax=Trinickia sp. LjRoot230 TaxID=3342288 RepID=UPI003ECC9E68